MIPAAKAKHTAVSIIAPHSVQGRNLSAKSGKSEVNSMNISQFVSTQKLQKNEFVRVAICRISHTEFGKLCWNNQLKSIVDIFQSYFQIKNISVLIKCNDLFLSSQIFIYLFFTLFIISFYQCIPSFSTAY